MPNSRKQKNATKRRKDAQKTIAPKRRVAIAHRYYGPHGAMMATLPIMAAMIKATTHDRD